MTEEEFDIRVKITTFKHNNIPLYDIAMRILCYQFIYGGINSNEYNELKIYIKEKYE